MAEEKQKNSRMTERTRRLIARFSNRFLLIRSFFALTLFAASYIFFTPLLRLNSDLGRIFLAVYGGLILILALFIVIEYFIKTVRLQNSDAKNYSAIVSINTFLGVIIPLFYSNAILATVIKALSQIQNYGTFFCEIRCSVVKFYYHNDIYYQVNQLIYLLVVVAFLFFLIGGFLEKNFRKN